MLIEVDNLSHIYAAGTPLQRQALTDVSLEISPGERVGVVGQTGSGKSTLVQHLAGLLEPTRGRVLLDGTPAHRRTAAARAQRRRVGIAFQYPEEQIFEQSVFREVAFGPRNFGVEGQELSARVSWALQLVGLDPDILLERSPFTLSGGEMRRVALAGVLAMQPDVLILDEPTVGLDPRGRARLLDRIEAWREDMRHTLIVVSHDLAALAQLVDRAIVLHNGKVSADGPIRRAFSDVRTLCAAALTPPAPTALLLELRRAGWPVRTDQLTPEEVACEIAEADRRRPAANGASGEER